MHRVASNTKLGRQFLSANKGMGKHKSSKYGRAPTAQQRADQEAYNALHGFKPKHRTITQPAQIEYKKSRDREPKQAKDCTTEEWNKQQIEIEMRKRECENR